ncbi:MAG: protein kinase [Dictyoglomus sp. NZ13-RE01]|nr:MAG: protein kinase [Dictyoglomus sp. NZ13-RE01]
MKNKKFLRILIFSIILILTLILINLDLIQNLENRSIDWRFKWRGEIAPPDDIVIIGIDDTSINEIGNWPWSRKVHAKLLDILKPLKPKLIIMDIIFDTKTKDDDLLSQKIKENRVILANYLQSLTDPKLKVLIYQIKDSVPTIKNSALYNGLSNLVLDKDAVVRRSRLYMEDLNGIRYYALHTYAYSYLNRMPVDKILQEFPTEFYINYYGGTSNIKTLSYSSILNKEIDLSVLKDKIIFIGSVSELLKDSYVTPFSDYKRWGKVYLSNMPGVEIHANILSNMLYKNYITSIPNTLKLFLFVFLLSISFFLQRKNIFFNLFLILALGIFYSFINFYLFRMRILLPFILPLSEFFLSFIGNTIYFAILPKESLEGLIIKKRYKLIKKLGSGGMATVYLAKDLTNNNQVAVKILHPQYCEDPQVVERFLREAKASSELDHPNIVKVFDSGREEDYYFIVMEYVPGKDLKKILEEKGPLSYVYVKEIIKEVAKALDHANQKGIVHRDIKPQNIMITPTGQVKLMDFGIAHIGGLSTLTQTGIFMGTPQYASPEQAEGSKVDIRSDIYSLGVVAFELLTGTLPFEVGETTISIIFKKLQEELPDVRTFRKEVPEGFAKIIQKMTARFPEDRYQSPKELIEDLERGYPLKPYEKKKISSQETIIKPKEE